LLPAAVRISVSATAIRRGQSVLVGMRAVDARTGAAIRAATIELWQRPSGKPWQRAGRYTASSQGRVQTTRRPTVTVTYQARLLASNTHQSATSATKVVRVT
jgi:protocatechuate 3,4-dioxygenase beta subunit